MSPNESDLDVTRPTSESDTISTPRMVGLTQESSTIITLRDTDHCKGSVWDVPSTQLQFYLVGAPNSQATAINKITARMQECSIVTKEPIVTKEQVGTVSFEMLRSALDSFFSNHVEAKIRDERQQNARPAQIRLITVSAVPIKGLSTVSVTDVSYKNRSELIPAGGRTKTLEFGKDEVLGLGVIHIQASELPSSLFVPGEASTTCLDTEDTEGSDDDGIQDEQ